MLQRDDLTFTPGEYARRLEALRRHMERRRLDVVVVTGPENICWLCGHQTTGYSYFQAIVVPIDREPFSITRLLEDSNIVARTNIEVRRSYDDTSDAIECLRDALCEFGLERGVIGFDRGCYFFDALKQERFRSACPDAMFADACGLVEACRIVKSPEEIEVMRRAARATVAGMEAGMEVVRPGVSENEIAAAVHHAMFACGGEYPAVAPYITSGPRTIIGHATWEGRIVQPDECVFLEIGGCYRRYHTAMMRTAYTGKPPRAMWDAEQVVLEALHAMMDAMRPGAVVSEVDAVPRRIISAGTGQGCLLTRSGYSIGIAFAPAWDEGNILSLKPGEDGVLRENMTFHLIPWMYGIEGDKVMGISETVRITADGCESFFDQPRELFVRAG